MGKNEGRMDQDQERRKGADLRIKLAKGAGIVSWLFFIALLIAIQIAKPQFETILQDYTQDHLGSLACEIFVSPDDRGPCFQLYRACRKV